MPQMSARRREGIRLVGLCLVGLFAFVLATWGHAVADRLFGAALFGYIAGLLDPANAAPPADGGG